MKKKKKYAFSEGVPNYFRSRCVSYGNQTNLAVIERRFNVLRVDSWFYFIERSRPWKSRKKPNWTASMRRNNKNLAVLSFRFAIIDAPQSKTIHSKRIGRVHRTNKLIFRRNTQHLFFFSSARPSYTADKITRDNDKKWKLRFQERKSKKQTKKNSEYVKKAATIVPLSCLGKRYETRRFFFYYFQLPFILRSINTNAFSITLTLLGFVCWHCFFFIQPVL